MSTKKAIALRYEHGQDPAPKVVAKGQAKVAERIIEIAKARGVPLREDPYLAEALMQVPLYWEIPPELYRAVAELLVFIYRRCV